MSELRPENTRSEPTAAQWRVITAALRLFAEHGVGGTSLRMIAAELGVTMAAVYHQFRTKDAIIFAAVESELLRLQAVVDAAEAEPTVDLARQALITGMVDMTIGTGRSVSTVLNDPAVTGTFSRHAGYRELLRRIRRILMDEPGTREARIRTATVIAAINGTATHPLMAELDDDTLRNEVLFVAERLSRLPAGDG